MWRIDADEKADFTENMDEIANLAGMPMILKLQDCYTLAFI